MTAPRTVAIVVAQCLTCGDFQSPDRRLDDTGCGTCDVPRVVYRAIRVCASCCAACGGDRLVDDPDTGAMVDCPDCAAELERVVEEIEARA